MGAINFFESIDHLEPKCEKCQSKIDYGVTTEFDEEQGCHVCIKCGNCLK